MSKRFSENFHSALLMTGAMAAITINDGFMKALSDEIPLFQAIFVRGFFTSLLLLIMAHYVGGLNFSMGRRDWGLTLLRGLGEFAASIFFITALFNMSFANVTAILQALPLTVTLGGAFYFREAIGWRRVAAILVGLFGVLLIVQPGAAGFNIYSIYAILAVLCITVREIASRCLSPSVPSMTIALVASIMVTVGAGLGAVSEEWARPSLLAWAQLGGSVVFLMAAYILGVMTMRVGDIGAVAPFRYVSLLVALIIGLVVFGEWPDTLTMIGALIVVATGVFTLYRERQVSGRAPRAALRPR